MIIAKVSLMVASGHSIEMTVVRFCHPSSFTSVTSTFNGVSREPGQARRQDPAVSDYLIKVTSYLTENERQTKFSRAPPPSHARPDPIF